MACDVMRGAWVLAIDIPSGLDGDTGLPARNCVQADLTATIACVKIGLVADAATNAVGRLAIVPLEQLQSCDSGVWRMATSETLKGWLPARPFDLHKGDCGRVGILAGSPGFLGAARLCSAAAVHAGAGLVTVLAKSETAQSLAISCFPEVMVRSVGSYREVHDMRFDSLAIGPGLGLEHAGELLAVMREAVQPVVVDADALNALARDVTYSESVPVHACSHLIQARWNVCTRKRAEYASNGWTISSLLGIPQLCS